MSQAFANHVVAKDFKSINRVFKAGDPITPDDIDPETVLSFEQWKERGFIVEDSAAAVPAPRDHSADEPATTEELRGPN